MRLLRYTHSKVSKWNWSVSNMRWNHWIHCTHFLIQKTCKPIKMAQYTIELELNYKCANYIKLWAVENGNHSNMHVFDTQLAIRFYNITSPISYNWIHSNKYAQVQALLKIVHSHLVYLVCICICVLNFELSWNWWWISNYQLNYLIVWISTAYSNQFSRSLARPFFAESVTWFHTKLYVPE